MKWEKRILLRSLTITFALFCTGSASGSVIATGDTNVDFISGIAFGPGDTDFGTGHVYVGGTLTVNAGSTLRAEGLNAGLLNGSNSNVVVDGPGSQIILTRAMAQGGQFGSVSSRGRTADISITNGGAIKIEDTNNLCLNFGDCFIGSFADAAGSTSNITVSGSGSLLDVDLDTSSQLFVIGDTSVFTQAADGFNFGEVGGSSIANLAVSNGGTLETGHALVASGGGGPSGDGTETVSANVVIDGAGSVWNSNFILAGAHDFDPSAPNTFGGIIVSNGGVINSPVVQIDDGGLLGGNGTINGDVFNLGGQVSPGLSPGTLRIDGDYTMNGGTLLIEVGGLGLGQFDFLDVTGAIDILAGEILFSFVDDFVPKVGDMFEFLSTGAGISIATNANYAFNGLAPGFDFFVDPIAGTFLALTNGSAVPLPATLSLFCLGLAGLGWSGRKRL